MDLPFDISLDFLSRIAIIVLAIFFLCERRKTKQRRRARQEGYENLLKNTL